MAERSAPFDFDADPAADERGGAAIGIDPRIAGRRDEVARVDRRRVRRRLFAGVLATLIVVGSAVGSRTAMFHVDQVDVAGAARTGEAVVIDEAGIALGTPMLAVDENQVDGAVSALPWVESVDVRRRWPSTVEISVRERDAVAAVPAGEDRWQLVGADGVVVAEVDEVPSDLVLVLGVPAAPVPGARIDAVDGRLSVAAAVPERLRDRVSAVVEMNGELQLHMDPSGLVRLGDTTRLDEKLVAIETLFTQVDGRCIDVVDVRAPQAPTIRRDDACAGPPPTSIPTAPVSGDAVTLPGASTDTTATTAATTATTATSVTAPAPTGVTAAPTGGSPTSGPVEVVTTAPPSPGILP